jgi:hypothetical protein
LYECALVKDSVGIGATSPEFPLSVRKVSSANDTFSVLKDLGGGTDGTLGSMRVMTGVNPSATSGNRYGSIFAGDFGNLRPLILNWSGSSYGNVGIGTTNPDERLVVFNGSTTGKYTTGGWTHSSDIRLKHDVAPLENSLDKILKLQGVEYKFNSDPKQETQVGFIAQQVEQIFPEVVKTDKNGFKSMIYSNLVAPLVEAVKTLYSRVVGVEREIASVKAEMEAQLKAKDQKIEELEQRLERIEKSLKSK